jgi:ClpP class serine protease
VITDRTALARLAGRPLAIAPRRLDALLASAGSNGAGALGRTRERDGVRGSAVTDAGIAIVPVVGPLVGRHDWLSSLFGATSYGEIGDAVERAFADPAARAVLLELDSPGGEVGGLFDLVEGLSALREKAGKPLWAVASESALSAAFAIASVADRLYVTRTGEVGSVGVVAVHIDESAADAMAGLKWTLIHAGARKVDGNSHQPLSTTAHADIQADVDALHSELIDLVTRNRGMAPDAVRSTEAAIYRGARGVEIGLADRVGTIERALADLSAELDAPPTRVAPRRAGATSPTSPRSPLMTTTDPPAPAPAHAHAETPCDPSAAPEPARQPSETPAAPLPTPVPPADAAADAIRAEYAEIAAIAAQAGRLGVTVDAADAMRKGIKPDALRRSVLDALAARAEAISVVSASATQPKPGESPIVRRARERAGARA